MSYIPILINAAALICGGVVDFRRREIPNAVPILLFISGFLNFSTLWGIMGLVIPAALLFIAAKLTRSKVPGGDFKLLCALGFACGLPELAAIILLSGIGAVAYGFIKRLPLKRHIPLCSCPGLSHPPRYRACTGKGWKHVKLKKLPEYYF